MQLVVLDRDGVINEELEHGVHSPSEWKPIRGSLEAIARLHHAGWKVAVAMNMPVTASTDIESLLRINSFMLRRVRESGGMIEGIFFCPHASAEQCGCHKPRPGLLQEITARFKIRLSRITFIGDGLEDIQAASACGVNPLLVKTGKGFGTAGNPGFDSAIPVFDDLYSAVESLLAEPGL